MTNPDKYSWVLSEENRFQSDEIRVGDNWNWNFRNHVQLLFHLSNGVFFTGSNDYSRAFKSVMEAIIEVANWTEDIEQKDVLFYIAKHNGRVLSFLVKKYYEERYVKENDLDTFIDEVTESDNLYGGVLVQKTSTGRPEVIQLNTIAFCDQTDVLGGPLALKVSFAPDKLRQMSKLGWGEEKNGATISIDELITLAETSKSPDGLSHSGKNQTPGKNIEVYILKGNLPEHYLKVNDDMEHYTNQVQVLGYYTDKKNNKQGVTLYAKKDDGESLKFHTTKKVQGRGLGRGIGERLIHPQVWTNFLEIHKTNMLQAASKVPLYTDDPDYTSRNKIRDMENLEITTIAEGKDIKQVPTAAPANLQLLENAINTWFAQGQLLGAAFDPILGMQPNSGTTFRGQERTVSQAQGPHNKRRGQRAKFLEEIYRDWIIPKIKTELLKGQKFLANLTADEMEWMTEQLAENYANRTRNEAVLSGEIPPDKDELKQQFLKDFATKGSQHLIEILEGEFEDIEIEMGINIAGKQKDLVGLSDKVLSIFQAILANPLGFQQAMQIPGMAKAFNDILEFSGISPADFASFSKIPAPQMMQPGMPQQPGQQQPQQMQLNQPQPTV